MFATDQACSHNDHYREALLRMLLVFVFILLSTVLPQRSVYGYGEIYTFKAPEEIPEGDDVSVVITASLKEQYFDRGVVVDFPAGWKIKRAYSVIAGGADVLGLPQSLDLSDLYPNENNRTHVVFADTNSWYGEEAAGVAYFIVFSTQSTAQVSATVKCALIERVDPMKPPELDPKTRKPKSVNSSWKMAFPFRPLFTLADLSGKKSVQVIRLLKGWRIGRALDLDGLKYADAVLRTKPEAIRGFFAKGFSLECWFKVSEADEPLITLTRNGREAIQIRTSALGQMNVVRTDKAEALIRTNAIFSDGIWHHLAISLAGTFPEAKMRLFVDAQLFSTTEIDRSLFKDIDGMMLGEQTKPASIWIDELHLVRRAYERASDFQSTIVSATRDTTSSAFAVFHFNDFGSIARSSIGLILPLDSVDSASESEPLPIEFVLDSAAKIAEATSPVQTDEVVLTADMISQAKVNVAWRTTTELGVKEYALERRIGNSGPFQKVLTVEAKHGMRVSKKGVSILYRNSHVATEELPTIRGDVELYYRIAIIGYDKDTNYSEPVKIEYGGDRDVFVEQNQPNPFNPTTQISFRLVKPEAVTMSVYDIIGRAVANVVNGKLAAGKHSYQIDGSNWPGGIYFYRVKTPNTTVTRKMVLAK